MSTERFETLKNFELQFHDAVFGFLATHAKVDTELDVLDISLDSGVFTHLLCQRFKVKRFVTAHRDSEEKPYASTAESAVIQLSDSKIKSSLEALGKFDMIIIKEMLHEVETLKLFFESAKVLFRDANSIMFIITRPKNPPVPLPDSGMAVWRKYVPTREDILDASSDAGYKLDTFSASCPISVEKEAWGEFLKGRFLAAVKNNKHCTDRDIKEFINDKKSPKFEFEEKIMIVIAKMES